MTQIQRICFTYIASIWGDSGGFSADAEKLLDWLELNSKFCRIGVETAPTTGATHWQGYAELHKRWRITQLHKLGMRWHVEACKGDQSSNLAYCSKDGNFVDHGVFIEQKKGKRNDLSAVRAMLATSGVRGVAAAGASLHQIKYAEKLVTYLEDRRDWQPVVIYIQGPSGFGKSSLACDLAELFFPGEDNKYTKSSNNKWFDGYDAHPVVILDDWRDSWWPMTYTLGLTDRYECRVECKGGSRQLLAKIIIVTSVKDFTTVYSGCSGDGEPIHQFRRRFSYVITLTEAYKNVVRCAGGWGNTRAQPLAQDDLGNLDKVDTVVHAFIQGSNIRNIYRPCDMFEPTEEDQVVYETFGSQSLLREDEGVDSEQMNIYYNKLVGMSAADAARIEDDY